MQQLPGDSQAQDLHTPAPSNTSNSGFIPSNLGDTKSNLSSFLPAGMGNTLANTNPSTFGEQIANQAKQQVIGVILGPIQKLKDEIEKTIGDKVKLETDHIKNILDITSKGLPTTTYDSFGTQIIVPPVYTPEEVVTNREKENKRYDNQKTIINNNLATLTDRLEKIILDPYNKIKKDIIKAKVDIAKFKTRSKGLKAQMDKQKLKQLRQNVVKSLVVTTAGLLTEQLIKTITDNTALQDLVDKTNDIIDAATTIDELNQARVARNGCISKINQQEARIQATIKVLNTINIILQVFSILARILDILNIPSPFGVAAKPLAGLYYKAAKILDEASAVVSILVTVLDSTVYVLEDLKNQLHDINQKIEEKTLLLLNDIDLGNYLNNILNSSTNPLCDTARLDGETDEDYYNRLRSDVCIRDLLASQNPTANPLDLSNLALFDLANQVSPPNSGNLGTYKGFTFITKEETDPKFVVKGFKRHYVLAIDTKNVERLKSDYSFTLNPQQLVSQLKFIIDQQNLQG